MGNVGRFRVYTPFDAFQEYGYVPVVEWHGSSEHGVENDAQAPDIALRSAVGSTENHLGGGVERAATVGLQVLVSVHFF